MPQLSLIIHERVAHWSRQLRPRFDGRPIRWVETRSSGDLSQAATRTNCPILIVSLDEKPDRGLRDLFEALRAAPDALSLVIDPSGGDERAGLARELGATHVLSGPVVAPEVERWVRRWLPIAEARSAAFGWSTANRDHLDSNDSPDLESAEDPLPTPPPPPRNSPDVRQEEC